MGRNAQEKVLAPFFACWKVTQKHAMIPLSDITEGTICMSRSPILTQGGLSDAAGKPPIALDTPAWLNWLSEHTAFAYQGMPISFTARREQRPGGSYWYAYKRVHGRLLKRYLGRGADLTEQRLQEVAQAFLSPDDEVVTQTATPALVATRFVLPRLPPGAVPRPQLLARFTHATERSCTMIIAPAGFGKTTLLALGCEPLRALGWHIAWLSLETSERDLMRFWLYLFKALERAASGSTREALRVLRESSHIGDSEALLIPLINTLAKRHVPLLLVLDDYHLAETSAIDATLLFLVEHLPDTLRLIILSRSEPALPLARWRVQGLLAEIRQEELRFSHAEVERFLTHTMDLHLDAEQVTTLETRTEGWIAGLQLVALSLHGQTDGAAFLAHFTGSNRYIGDYLMGEVINGQGPDIQNFLLRTAMLPRLCGALCDAVTGRNDGQALLERVEAAHLFIVPLDQQQRWYRYHHLFAEMLCERLTREQPALLRDCHTRAAVWFAAQGETHEAIEQALAGQAYSLAASLLETETALMLQRGEVTNVLTWLRALPTALLDRYGRLALLTAAVLLMDGDLENATPILQRLEALLLSIEIDATFAGELAAVRAFHTLITHGDMPATQAFAQEALRCLPSGHGFLRDLASLLNASMTLLLAPGDLAAMVQLLTQTVQSCIRRGNYPIASFALDNRALKECSQGHLYQAERTCQEALHLPLAPHLQETPFTNWAYLRLGDIYREWNQLERACEMLEHGLAQPFGLRYPEIAVDGYLALARVSLVLDQRERADEMFRILEHAIQTNQLMLHTVWQVEACRARLLYMWGQTTEALLWSVRYEEHLQRDKQQTPLALTSFSDFTLARFQLVQERYAEVRTLLERLLVAAQVGGRGHSVIEACMLLALVEQATGHANDAQQRITQALSLASAEGFVRLFLDEGSPMLQLLSHLLMTRASTPEQRVAAQYARVLLTQAGQSFSASPYATRPDLPSTREMEILRLLAAGNSNTAIATELFLALSTVKWHIARLYSKLDVHTRTQAVARARELKLFDP